MSAALARSDLMNMHCAEAVRKKAVAMFVSKGASARTIKLITRMGNDFVEEALREEVDFLNAGEYNLPPAELDKLLDRITVVCLKASSKALTKEWKEARAELPCIVVFCLELLFYPRFRTLRELNRIVEGL